MENMEAAAKSKGKKRDPHDTFPHAAQLAAALEQAAVMDSLHIDVVLPEVPDYLMSTDDEPALRTRHRGNATRRIEPVMLQSANELLLTALKTRDDGDVKQAVRVAKSVGLKVCIQYWLYSAASMVE